MTVTTTTLLQRCCACGVAVDAASRAVRYDEALCDVTPDSVHTLNPESVEIGATTSTLKVSQPGSVWLFFTTAEARAAYVARYGHRYDYHLEWDDVSGFAYEGVTTFVKGAQPRALVPLVDGAVGLRDHHTDDYWDS